MSVGLLLVTHDGVGSILLETACNMLGRCPVRAGSLAVALAADADEMRAVAARQVALLDDGDGVLVLTDMYGSTPSNVAASLAREGRVVVVAGVNLPMLVRVMNYPEETLGVLADKAVSGGNRGILICNGPGDGAPETTPP